MVITRDPSMRELIIATSVIALLFAGNAFWQWYGYRSMFTLVERFENERQQRRSYYFSGAESGEGDENSECEEFAILLNRTPDYLRNTAITFARSYDLGESVSELYSGSSQASAAKRVQQNRKLKKKKKRGRHQGKPSGKQHLASDFSRWDTKKQIEPIFDMPIDREHFWLSSPFGPRREPRGGRGFHFGIDMAAVRGTPVKAAGDGIVIFAGQMPGYGNVIVIKHDGKFKTRYAHLSKILTSYGAHVAAGKVIGKVGSTGNSRASGKTRDASHLHFEVEMYGKRVNPFYFFK